MAAIGSFSAQTWGHFCGNVPTVHKLSYEGQVKYIEEKGLNALSRLVEEVHADGGCLGLPLEGEVLDVLRLVADDRDEGVLVQVEALDGQHGGRADVQLRAGSRSRCCFVSRIV